MEPLTGNPKIDAVFSIIGAVVPLLSAVASFLNHIIRVQTSKGDAPNPILLGTGSVLNVASVNIDKGVQLAKMALGRFVPNTGSAPKND